ncbi:MAG: glutamate--tRNA ligase [Steroidobacteraceae bacterium]
MSSGQVVTRFAPSPSGELHLGNVRTALFSYLLARARGGRFLLRIEDTDATRSSDPHVEALLRDLKWLGLSWDGEVWRQSQRTGLYVELLERLRNQGRVYPCFCTPLQLELSRKAQRAAGQPPRYAGTCRDLAAAEVAARFERGESATLRFRVPAGAQIRFEDRVHGAQLFRSDDIGDFIVRREDGSAAFFFANAVDDALSGVNLVLRGEDHLSNTPRQMLVLEALGLPVPRYGHLALLLGGDGAPLSKRNGAQSLRELAELGYAPLAVANQLFRLGHSTPVNDLLDLPQLAAHFDASHLQRAAAHFDLAQLDHWQSLWVQSLQPEYARRWLQPLLPAGLNEDQAAALVAAILPNTRRPADAAHWISVIYRDPLTRDEEARAAIERAGQEFFRATAAAVGERVELAELRRASGRKGAEFFRPLRAALTGSLHGPEFGPLLALMPVERVRARLRELAG